MTFMSLSKVHLTRSLIALFRIQDLNVKFKGSMADTDIVDVAHG